MPTLDIADSRALSSTFLLNSSFFSFSCDLGPSHLLTEALGPACIPAS